ncbi:MAG TPA: ABC transporter substrate-binding protein [Stellaceae bacterium]|nr:ABC transporter substrate-binding protein [Stellaceae bacterium]
MTSLLNRDGSRPHPAAFEFCEQYRSGLIDRRTLLRTLGWLGVSALSMRAVAGPLAPPPEEEAPVSGGVLRFVCAVQQMTDPALSTWTEASNIYRNALEYLTYVDHENVTHPYLAQSWTPSEDLKTWDFTLRDGVIWSNGDKFTSDDVVFNIGRWISPQSKSANRTTFSAIREIEKIDDLRFRLHLDRPLCSLPEQLYAWICPMLHRRFDEEGGDWPKNPIGTGPFRLAQFEVSRVARMVRRDGYWGRPAYLDEIQYIDLGTEVATHLAALAAGQVDLLYRVTVAELDLVARLDNVRLLKVESAQTMVMRMQVDQKPFDDIRVRRAVALAADNKQMLDIACRGQGLLGENHHVAPIHPDYAPLPPLTRDVAKAKALLAEAGYPDGIDLTLSLGNTQGRWEQDTAQILQQNCLEAGIRISLDVMPPAEYWSVWNQVPFGLTFWAHRPLGVMTLDLAYRSGAAWNETHFKDPEFDAALDRAMGILDPHARATTMAEAERILQDRAVIVQAYWAETMTAASDRVRGHRADPSEYYRMDGVWLVPERS